ncbi:hypothetical protein ACH4TS_23555 [Streptomyces albidoflavus]
MLRDFDGVVSEDSSAAALFEIWSMAVLRPAWLKQVAPQSADTRGSSPSPRSA